MQSETTANKEQSSILYFIKLLLKNWKFLLATYITVGITTVIILLVIPKWYKSEATVVVLGDKNSALASMMSQFNAFGIGLGGQSNIETYMEYVHTKKMYNQLIDKFNLDEVYESTFIEDTYEIIFQKLSVTNNENNTFKISYQYEENPEKAAEITQFIFDKLDEIVLEVDKAEATNFLSYIETYYNDTRSTLDATMDSLVQFQEKTGILDIEIQTQATIEGLAELEMQRIKYEIERNYVTEVFEDRSKLVELDTRISAIQAKINNLLKNSNSALVALNDIPKQGARFLQFKRDILVGEKVAEFLRLQYEQALLDQNKINSNLYLLDPPNIPEKRFKPQRAKLLVTVMFFTVVLSLLFIKIKEFYNNNREYIMGILKESD